MPSPTLQEILRVALPGYANRHALPGYVRFAARRVVQCRTEALGGHVIVGEADNFDDAVAGITSSHPDVAIHQFGSGNAKIEQRFLLGTGARRFTVRRSWMNDTQRLALRNFWESKYGPYGAFTYNAPNDDGNGTTAFTCRNPATIPGAVPTQPRWLSAQPC